MYESLMKRDETHGHNKHAARVMKIGPWTYLRSMALIRSGLKMISSIKPSHLSRAMCGFIATVSKPAFIVSQLLLPIPSSSPPSTSSASGGPHRTRYPTRRLPWS